MLLGGVEVGERVVRELAAIVSGSLRGKLETALLFRAKIVGLIREGAGGSALRAGEVAGRAPGRP